MLTSLIPSLGRWRQSELCKLDASLVSLGSPRIARATERPCLETKLDSNVMGFALTAKRAKANFHSLRDLCGSQLPGDRDHFRVLRSWGVHT